MLPPLDTLDQFFTYFAPHGTARQQVFGAIDFRGFAQDGRAAVRHQQIYRRAQCRVGTDTGVTVRAAALQSDGDVCGAAGFAPDRVGLGQHVLDQRNAFGDGFGCAARVLDAECAQCFAFAQAAVGQPGIDLVGLAAQPHHQHAGKIDVGGVAGQRALQYLHANAFAVHAATRAVRQRDDTVHVGKILEHRRVVLPGKMISNSTRRGSRAVDAGQDAEIVARGHATIGALDAHESRFTLRRRRFHVSANGIVAHKIAFVGAHIQVVGVHMFAGRDGPARKPDDLVVAPHRLAGRQRARGHLVARRDQALDDDVFDLCAAHQLGAGNQDIVGGMKADKGFHVAVFSSINH